MNYRHAFHAGNFADVMKHALLARILLHLNAKPAAWHYLDTHAGIGLYDLDADEASRSGESRNGIARLETASFTVDEATLLAPYLDCIAGLRQAGGKLYPGSPEIARSLARPQDRLTLAELHPEDARRLKRTLAHDPRARILELDGWTALKANLPPRERRGLVLIDPPFEEADEFERIARSLIAAHRKWSTGIYAIWYPIKHAPAVAAFKTRLAEAAIAKILCLELRVDDPAADRALAGSGLIIVNPPWTLEREADCLLPLFARLLGRSAHAGAAIQWLAGENQ